MQNDVDGNGNIGRRSGRLSGVRLGVYDRVAKLAARKSPHGPLPAAAADSTCRVLLNRWVQAQTTPQRLVRRSWIALMALDGMPPEEIAARLGVSQPTVKLWTERFAAGGPEALLRDAPGRGRRASLDPATIRDRLRDAGLLDARGRPVSLRRAGARLGVSASAVWRALRKSA